MQVSCDPPVLQREQGRAELEDGGGIAPEDATNLTWQNDPSGPWLHTDSPDRLATRRPGSPAGMVLRPDRKGMWTNIVELVDAQHSCDTEIRFAPLFAFTANGC